MLLRDRKIRRVGISLQQIVWLVCFMAACGGAEVAWALPGTSNLALGGTAMGTLAEFGSSLEDAIDGNRNGNFYDGSVYYANAIPESPPLFYEVDLGMDAYVDRVQILGRSDEAQAVFGNFQLTIFEDDGAGNPGSIAFTGAYNPTEFVSGSWGTTEPDGVLGRHVRFERLDNNYWITFAELEVIGSTSPLAFSESDNIAAGKSVTSSSAPGFGALLSSGNDGNIDGNFGHPGYRPVYHSSVLGVGEYWQVNLESEVQLDHLQLFTRTDANSTSEFKVSVLDASLAEVDSFIVENAPLTDPNPDYDLLINTAGIIGQYVRIETTLDEHLVFSELRAFEGPGSSFGPGDYNQDGSVTEADFLTWRSAFGTSDPAVDGNENGIVDAADYTVWRDNYVSGGSGIGVASLAVPEPSTTVALGIGLVSLCFCRRRQLGN